MKIKKTRSFLEQQPWRLRRGKFRRYTDDEIKLIDELDELRAKLEKVEKDKLTPGDIRLIGYRRISKALGYTTRYTKQIRHKLEEAGVMWKRSDGKWEASLFRCRDWKKFARK